MFLKIRERKPRKVLDSLCEQVFNLPWKKLNLYQLHAIHQIMYGEVNSVDNNEWVDRIIDATILPHLGNILAEFVSGIKCDTKVIYSDDSYTIEFKTKNGVYRVSGNTNIVFLEATCLYWIISGKFRL